MDSVFIISLLGAVYLLINLTLPHLPLDARISTYLIQPLLWLRVVLFVKTRPALSARGKHSRGFSLLLLAGIFGGVQVISYMFTGLFSGFGSNPSSLTPSGIALDLFFVGAMLLSMELSRSWLVNHPTEKYGTAVLLGVSLFFALLVVPLSQITGFARHIVPARIALSLWLPLVAESLLASRLALLGGWVPAIIYRTVLAAFWRFSPVLPGLPWQFLGLIGMVVPVLCMLALEAILNPGASKIQREGRRASSAGRAGWIAAAALAVFIIWFAAGIFPIKPSVIASGSMAPFMKVGDIAIVARAAPGSIGAGDVIEFRRDDGSRVLHRVVQVYESGGETAFETMGDANSSPDSGLVLFENVDGKVIAVIPKLGWLSLTEKRVFGG